MREQPSHDRRGGVHPEDDRQRAPGRRRVQVAVEMHYPARFPIAMRTAATHAIEISAPPTTSAGKCAPTHTLEKQTRNAPIPSPSRATRDAPGINDAAISTAKAAWPEGNAPLASTSPRIVT